MLLSLSDISVMCCTKDDITCIAYCPYVVVLRSNKTSKKRTAYETQRLLELSVEEAEFLSVTASIACARRRFFVFLNLALGTYYQFLPYLTAIFLVVFKCACYGIGTVDVISLLSLSL